MISCPLSLQFCRRDVFGDLRGFDSTIYVGEDIDFGRRLDRRAHSPFIEEPKVLTSSRRWNRMGLLRLLFFTHPITVFARPPRAFFLEGLV
jgi:hypothetical protein